MFNLFILNLIDGYIINIINLIAMKNQVNDIQSTTEPLDISRKSYEDNPINAINKLKAINDNIEMMKNRYLVLRRRDEHNKYKTLDQQKRLNLHNMIHDRLKSQREQLRRSLEEIRDTRQIKQRSQTIRKQMFEGVSQAKKQLLNSNLQKYEQINQEATKHKETIDSNYQQERSMKRQKALSLKRLEQQQKVRIQMKLKQKRSLILTNKNLESNQLKQKQTEGQKVLQRLQRNQIQMIRETSKSIENSRLMSQKFTEVMMNLPTYRNKRSQKSQRQSFLPTIKQKNAHNNTLQFVIV